MSSLDGLCPNIILMLLATHVISKRQAPAGLTAYFLLVIGGFFITRPLLREDGTAGCFPLSRLDPRRITRLYPKIAVLLVCDTGLLMAFGRPSNLLEPASAREYLSVYFDRRQLCQRMLFDPFWSPAVQEHFSTLLPLAVVLLWQAGAPNAVARRVLCHFARFATDGGKPALPDDILDRSATLRADDAAHSDVRGAGALVMRNAALYTTRMFNRCGDDSGVVR